MQNLLNELKTLLSGDDRLVVEGKLIKNKIIELALALDKDLLETLISSVQFKKYFFEEVTNCLVFDKIKFMKFVSNKEFLPDSYTSFKNKIGLTSDDEFISEKKEVVLSFPYKDCYLEGEQTREGEKRNELFFNEVLAPEQIDTLTLPKVFDQFSFYDKDGDHQIDNISSSDNLIIKGNNLLTLYSLKKIYSSKIKLIYIDPPYNTGNDDFLYNDSFNHSTWLTFMKNRLSVAKDLLSSEGMIFISCDDNEQAYLKVLCDEIFGRENFINNLVWHKKRGKDNSAKYFSINHEFILVYAKRKEYAKILRTELDESTKKAYRNSDNDPRGPYRVLGIWSRQQGGSEYEFTTKSGHHFSKRLWLVNLESMRKLEEENKLIINGDKLYYKLFLSENQGSIPETIWLDGSNNANAKDEIKTLFGEVVFATPKPTPLITKILKISTGKDDIILDFFAGSGTTAQAVLDLNKEDGGNRKFILCEQMDYIKTVTVQRVLKTIQKNGFGSFVYCELAKLNEQIAEEVKNANGSDELKFIYEKVISSPFLNYKVNIAEFEKNTEEFESLSLELQKQILLEMLDRNLCYVNYSEIEDADYNLTEVTKKLNKIIYSNYAN